MRYSNLLLPISDMPPCGPDLDASGDDEFFNYTISADARLPDRFVNVETGRVFDRTSIALDDEDSRLSELLSRSRDLRLVVLRAQFHAVAGSVASFSECLEVMPALLDQYWADVHPQMVDGDLTYRKLALEGLTDRAKIVMPLTYAVIVRDRRLGPVSLRSWQVTSRPEIAYKDESKLSAVDIAEVFAAPDNQTQITSTLAAVATCLRALSAVRSRFLEDGDFESVPSFDSLLAVLNDINALVRKHAASPDVGEPLSDLPVDVTQASPHAPAPQSVGGLMRGAKAVAVGSHREAKSALASLEAYFAESEASSPALILVHQAKLLIGRPLVEALAALAPGRYNSAVLYIDEKSGFFLDLEKMKQLTVPISNEDGVGILKRFGSQDLKIEDRQQAFNVMIGIESYISEKEPSSPIPILLSRARDMMSLDFSSIYGDVFRGESK